MHTFCGVDVGVSPVLELPRKYCEVAGVVYFVLRVPCDTCVWVSVSVRLQDTSSSSSANGPASAGVSTSAQVSLALKPRVTDFLRSDCRCYCSSRVSAQAPL